MTSVKAREYTKWYERYYVDHPLPPPNTLMSTSPRKQRDPSVAPHPPYTGDIGYGSEMGKRIDLSLVAPPNQHKLAYGIGIQNAHHQRQHIFTELPGRTFDASSRQLYTTATTSLRRTTSPVKARTGLL